MSYNSYFSKLQAVDLQKAREKNKENHVSILITEKMRSVRAKSPLLG
jgi:hypothetical protein